MKQLIKLISILLFTGVQVAKGQIIMSGPTKVRAGATANYTAISSCSQTNCWGVNYAGEPAGTLSNTTCSPWVPSDGPPPASLCGCPNPMGITFNNFATMVNVSVMAEDKCGTLGGVTVTVVPPLVNNITISPSTTQSINCNAAGTTLTASTPTGGDKTYAYQWQSSTDNSTWINISGATGNSYTPSGLYATTFIRVLVTSFDYTVMSTNTVTVNVTTPAVSGGTISNTAQAVNYNTAPDSIICSDGSGGCNALSLTYQWQSSPNGSSWTNISGATGKNYKPGNLTATTYYRRVATNNGIAANSTNVATVTVYPQVATSISPSSTTINYNTDAGTLTNTRSGGNATYTYQWQSSVNNSTWSNINGATAQNYSPGVLTDTMYYRVITTSNGVSVTSNTATVKVYPQLVAGTVSPSAITINYNTGPGVLTGTAATGGNGTYTYQWQSSADNSSWTNINGVTTQNYTPGNLTSNIYYRRAVTSNSVTVYTTSTAVTVYPQVTTSISPASATINYNADAGTLTNTRSGGNSTYTYQWQSSVNNSTWTNINGATAQNYSPGILTDTMYYRVVTISNGASVTSNTATVNVYPQLLAGTVSPSSITINYNTSPGALTGTTATGGTGTYTYQWQSSTDNSSWTNVNGVTTQNYTPGNLTSNIYYRRGVTSNSVTVYTASTAVTVYPQITTSISPASTTINYNTDAGTLTNTRGGGNGTYTYQWQSSANNSTWTNINGATAQSYSPGVLTDTMYYRVITTSNGASVTSNTATVNVYPQLVAGTVSPSSITINYNTSPGALTGTSASGGNGTYTYQWQSSADNSSWTNVNGVTTQNYTAGNLTSNIYYRRAVTSNSVTVYTTSTAVTVYPQVTTSISPSSTAINYNTDAGTLTNTRSGGNGAYTYQWQSSANNSTWTNINGATAQSYNPGVLTDTMYYRVITTSNGASVTSNTATVNVYPQLVAGTVSPSAITINYNTSPGALTGTSASGGNGTYTYQWQSSADNSSWTNVNGVTTQNYTPGSLTSNIYYRRAVTSNSVTVYTTSTAVTVYPQVTTTISPSSSAINYNTDAGTLTNTRSGGNGTYTYQWQSSANNSTWTNISSAVSQNYSPGNLTTTTYYRVTTTSNGVSVISNTATISVYPQLVSDSIFPVTQLLNSGEVPDTLFGRSATGGAGTYTYLWQRSGDNVSWNNIGGATTLIYVPEAVTGTIYYRLASSSNGVTVFSNAAAVTIYTPLVPGAVNPVTINISHNTSPGVLSAGMPSGGDGNYTYQWQSATGNTIWSPISGATSASFSPDILTTTTYYRLVVTSNGRAVNTDIITVNVFPQLVAGQVSPDSITANYGSAASTFNAMLPSGGNSVYTYQWQTSSDGNDNWSNVDGATSLSYVPANFAVSAYYRLEVTSAGIKAYSNTVSVVQPLVGGIISASAPVVPSGSSVTLNNVEDASGPTCANVQYEWEVSYNEYQWSTLADAVIPIVKPVFVRRKAICGDNIGYSNIIGIRSADTSAISRPNGDTAPGNGTEPSAGMPVDTAGLAPENLNYVKIREFTKPGITAHAVADQQTDPYDVRQVTQYFDGLGRPMQTVAKEASPGKHDLISTNFYDDFGREAKKYLPYIDNGNGGKFRIDANVQQPAFYDNFFNNKEGYYYSNTTYEASPMNRVLQTTAPGKSWTGNNIGVRQLERTNGDHDKVVIWNIDVNSTNLPQQGGYYQPGTLSVNETIDEHYNKVIEYSDLDGRVVLKKVQLNDAGTPGYDDWLSTFYIYDDLGNLRFVIPPKAVEGIKSNWTLTQNIADELCFQYQYDKRRRMIEKRLPGMQAPTEMVYDVRDRLVFSRDGNQKNKGQWLGTFYDDLNRPVMTALYNNSTASRADLQTNMNNVKAGVLTIEKGIDLIMVTLPLSGLSPTDLDLLSYSFYDTYNNAGDQPALMEQFQKLELDGNQTGNVYPETPALAAIINGLPACTKVRILGTDQWLVTVTYYDNKARVIQVVTDNINGGKDVISNRYDFSGKLLSSYMYHTNPRSTATPQTTMLTMNVYDHGGRVKTSRKRLNDNAELERLVSDNDYDELGQLKSKKLGMKGTDPQLETLNYEYNIRGWLKGINKDFVNTPASSGNWFGQELSYDYGFETSQLNGNISGIKWKSKGNGIARAYGFKYDNANRLTAAEFNQQNYGSGSWTKDKVDYSVSNLHYDANGNILGMKQMGLKGNALAMVDDLTYHYPDYSNKLQYVRDATNEEGSTLGDFKEPAANNSSNLNNPIADIDYAYDPNANLTIDKNKRIENISYNYRNQPEVVTITGKGSIQYLYDAAGNKLRKIVTDNTGGTTKTTTTDYAGAVIYENDVLQFISHEEGRTRAVFKTGQPVSYAYDYFIKDHLGNVRMVLTDQTEQTLYAATMETENAEKEAALFSNIDNTRSAKPAGYTDDPTTDPNNYVSRLNAVNGQKIGPSLVLRVMAGDKLQIGAKAFYKSTAASGSSSLMEEMAAAVINAFSSLPLIGDGSHTGTGSGSPISMNFTGADYQHLKEKDPNQNQEDKPKSYLNFVLFDDQFNLVDENSGVKQVQGAPDELQTLATDQMEIKRTGFIYVYTSNESGQDVFFDNIVVAHSTGPLMEETHYYPFGLTMAGISGKSLTARQLNRFRYNSKEQQHEEFSDGSGLEWYDYGARMYDNQIGRFVVIDPKTEEYTVITPYAYAGNDPIRYTDIFGMGPGDRVKKAATFLGTPYKQQYEWTNKGDRTYLRTGTTDAALEYIDCSELVSRVLAADGITTKIESLATGELLDKLGDDSKFKSSDVPQIGDVFLWRYTETKKKGKKVTSVTHGHTGIVESIDEDGTVHTLEAYGTDEGTIRTDRKLSEFTSHKGWKGFFRPVTETPDGKIDGQKSEVAKQEKKDDKKQSDHVNVTISDGQTTTRTTLDPSQMRSLMSDILKQRFSVSSF